MTDTQAIKDKINIVQVIQEYVPLKKAGANWKAPCPFHREKSPSFMVHPEKQIFHCFGCGKGGDIFTFIQEIEGVDFPEALKLLAERAGIKLENNFQTEVNKSQKNRLLEINAKAAYFFHRFLLDMAGAKTARDYLEDRKLTAETIEKWKIGFVPDQWDLLTKYLLKNGFGIEDIIAAGLTIKRDGADIKTGRGVYDRFRGRIMFPIWDVHGNVVGFTGRVLVETEMSGGKYVNTPQSPVYDKSRVIYGLDKAKMEIKAKDLVVLVEGQMDVIACHQAGMANVVAASGTALTLEQVKLLKRYSNNLAMAFDADTAGQNAAKRGIDIAMQEGMNIRVINIPEGAGKDADECIKKNPAVWFEAVAKAKNVMDWYFAKILVGNMVRNPQEKQVVADALLDEIIKIPHTIEQGEWVKRLSDELDVDVEILRDDLKKRKIARTPKVSENRSSFNKMAQISQNKPISITEKPENMIFSQMFSLFVKFPSLYSAYASFLQKDFFPSGQFLALYEKFNNDYNTGQINPASWRDSFLLENSQSWVDVLAIQAERDFPEINERDAGKELEALIARIKKDWKKKRSQELQLELRRAERDNNKKKAQEILNLLQSLI